MKNYLVYLLIGENKDIINELKCSLFSLHVATKNHAKEKFKILVYTDKPLNFDFSFLSHEVLFVSLEQEDIKKWLMSTKFLLTLKPYVLKEALISYQGNVLFVDTDTIFMEDPSPLFLQISSGRLIMHLKEHSFKVRPALTSFLKETKISFANEEMYDPAKVDYDMWNSGVVGLNYNNIEKLNKVIKVIEQIRQHNKWHTAEQVAFSIIFGFKNKIVSAEKYIFHYWFFKGAVTLLAYFYSSSLDREDKNMLENYLNGGKNLDYDKLTYYIMRLFIRYSRLYEWHFYCLPFRSEVGKILRKTVITSLKMFAFITKIEFKYFFNKGILVEVNKKQYDV